jgi:hypothetical protein
MTGATFPAEELAFLARLKRNNSTDWFHAHKDDYRTLVQVSAVFPRRGSTPSIQRRSCFA